MTTTETSLLFDFVTRGGHYDWQPHVRYQQVQKSEYVYLPAQDLHDMYEILSGVVKIGSYSPQGEEIVYEILRPGDVIGNLRLLNGQFFEFAKALTPVSVRLYDLSFFKHLIWHDAQLGQWFTVYSVRRWCRMETRFFSVNANRPGDRILNLVRELSAELCDESGHKYRIVELLTQKDIAHLTGTTRQTVATVLRKQQKTAR